MFKTGQWLGNLQLTFITINIYSLSFYLKNLSEIPSAFSSFILELKDVRCKRDSQKDLITLMVTARKTDPANPKLQLPELA